MFKSVIILYVKKKTNIQLRSSYTVLVKVNGGFHFKGCADAFTGAFCKERRSNTDLMYKPS